MTSKSHHKSGTYQWWYCLMVIIILTSTGKKTKAQTPVVQNYTPERNQPPSTQPLPTPTFPSHLPPPQDLLLPPPTVTPSTGQTQDKIPQTIIVKAFEVTGSTVFNPKDFTKITQPYTKRPITFADILQLRADITNLYVSKGYINSGAYIPPQKLQSGVIEIRVLEGKLEGIKVTGTKRLNPEYIRSRLAIATGKPLNRDRLLEALQLLQLNPLIAKISAELSAGTRPGENLLEVQVKESQPLNAQLILDNGRSPAVGSFRRQIQVGDADLLGWGDSISAVYTNTDGSNGLDLNYTVPINPHNGTISFSYGFNNSNVIETPFSALDIQSNSTYYQLTLRQPIIQTPTKEFALGLTADHRESQANLLNGEVPFPEIGADSKGRTRITAIRFFQDWTQRNSKEVFALRSQFSFGFDALNSTINTKPPDSRFFSWLGQGQWVRVLAPDTLVLLRGNLQLADRPLVPLEQFTLGGIDNVRGYRQDALLSDNGFFASVELRYPIARFSRSNDILQLTPFVDFGTAWNLSATPTSNFNREPNTLVSAGLGLRLQLQDHLTASVDWGIPFVSISGNKKTWQENGLYFSIIANP